MIKKAERERRGKLKGERAKNGRDLTFFEKNQVYVHRLCAVGSEPTAFVEAWAGVEAAAACIISN